MADIDDGAIADDVDLLRRIHPDQVVHDANLGERRPSTGAFKDPELSVDAESILTAEGLDWRFSLRNWSGYSLAKFPTKSAREKQLPVIHRPEADNKAHTEVHGKKTQGIAKHLRAASSWVHLEPEKSAG
jgi:hypothetical protein